MPLNVLRTLPITSAAAAVVSVVRTGTAAVSYRAAMPAPGSSHAIWTPEETEVLVELYERLLPTTESSWAKLSDAFIVLAKARGTTIRSLEAIKSRFALVAKKVSTGGGAEAPLRTRAFQARMRAHNAAGSFVINDRPGGPTESASTMEDDDLAALPGDSPEARELQDQLRLRHSKANEAVARLNSALADAMEAPPLPNPNASPLVPSAIAASSVSCPSMQTMKVPPRKRRATTASILKELLAPPAAVVKGGQLKQLNLTKGEKIPLE